MSMDITILAEYPWSHRGKVIQKCCITYTLDGSEDEILFEEEGQDDSVDDIDDDKENFDKIDETVISLWIIKIK